MIFLIAGLLAYAGWRTFAAPAADVCSVCGRTIHPASRVEGVADGTQLKFCCAACALRAEGQQLHDLRVTRVFDFQTGKPMDPGSAFSVVGSDINVCMREHVLMGDHMEASDLTYDRCSPSILSFPTAAAAERFSAEHGGEVKPFADVARSFR